MTGQKPYVRRRPRGYKGSPHSVPGLVHRIFEFEPRSDTAGQLSVELDALAACRELRHRIDEQERKHASKARRLGASWSAIGKALDTTRQAAQKRFGLHLAP